MKKKFNKNYLEKYSRQIVLKDIGILGQKKISLSKILIVGLGGLGCPAVDYLCRAGVGQVGLVDFDKVKFCIEANFKTSLLEAFCSSSSATNCLLK